MVDIKKIIKEEGLIRKFQGVAPDGFVLVHEKNLRQIFFEGFLPSFSVYLHRP